MRKKPSRYRPKTGRNEQEGKRVTVRFTQEEYALVAEKAAGEGVTIARFLRERGLGVKLSDHRLDRDAQRQIWVQVAGLGRNLNQLTKKVNQEGLKSIPEGTFEGFKRLVQQVIDEVRSLGGLN